MDFGVCQSFSKNFGLYGERVGSLSFVTQNVNEKEKIESQLKQLLDQHIRPLLMVQE